MGHQELAGRSRFTWQGSEFSFVRIPGVILIMSTFMTLKSLSFELARATGRNFFIPFSVNGARKKMHAFSSSVHSSTVFGLILIYPFSVTPYICIINITDSYGLIIWYHSVTMGDLKSGAISSAHPVYSEELTFSMYPSTLGLAPITSSYELQEFNVINTFLCRGQQKVLVSLIFVSLSIFWTSTWALYSYRWNHRKLASAICVRYQSLSVVASGIRSESSGEHDVPRLQAGDAYGQVAN